MITYDEVLNLNYYKKASYTGWTGQLRFLIRLETAGPSGDEAEPQSQEPMFHVFAWPGPLIFDLTDEAKKTDALFPFTEEGKRQAVDWLNQNPLAAEPR